MPAVGVEKKMVGFWVYFEGRSNRIPKGLDVQYERKRIIKDDSKGFGLEEGSLNLLIL